jgi:hypothetical protein
MARRHVAEGSARVEKQAELVRHLRAHGFDTGVSERVLESLEGMLAAMRSDLLRREANASS